MRKTIVHKTKSCLQLHAFAPVLWLVAVLHTFSPGMAQQGRQNEQRENTPPAQPSKDEQPIKNPSTQEFLDIWFLNASRERRDLMLDWLDQADAKKLGEDAYLIPLADYVYGDYRNRPIRVLEMYDHFVKLEKTPDSLRQLRGFVGRFILRPLLAEIQDGELKNVLPIAKVAAGTGDPYQSYAPIGIALRRSNAEGAAEVYAKLVRIAAVDPKLGQERFAKLLELWGRITPDQPDGSDEGADRLPQPRGGRGDPSSGRGDPRGAREDRSGNRAERRAMRQVKQVPFVSFEGPDLDGNTISTKDFRGKVLLIDFWATWCGPCLKKAPEIVALKKEFADQGLAVLGVSLDKNDQEQRVREVAEKMGMTWPQIYSGGYYESEAAVLNNVQAIPEVILLDRQGRPRARGLTGEKLKQTVQKLLQESRPQQSSGKSLKDRPKPAEQGQPGEENQP